jgi:D-sedoheptulose 7-phosphate isomerase
MTENYIQESLDLKRALLDDVNFITGINGAIKFLNDCFKRGNKILIAGNGGSAADAQHFAAEIVCRYKKKRKGYPAIALTTDTSILTAWSNDYDFDNVFERQIEALGKTGDIFLGISTSGNSENIIKAVDKAKKMKMRTICLLGREGKLKKKADVCIMVPSDNIPRIQETHIMVLHIIAEELEKKFS